ncbi:hypothetical protein GE061_013411 [Apolygus lucorum]|uniref:DUF7869 domain-containing protein n=1 Tax=Apolygus lucorum TaxID=248454 RepID=A0A6A4JW35_APOLU|nr:hypothetical protein GE061_013411 [Apolygus lucorum]
MSSSDSEFGFLDEIETSADEYEPSSSSDSVEESVVPRVLKRKAPVDSRKWRAAVQKENIASGKSHITKKGMLIGPHKTGRDCKCKFGCFTKFTDAEKKNHLIKRFNAIGEKTKQDTYLLALISSRAALPPRRPLTQNPGNQRRRNFVNEYRIKNALGSNIRVCRKAFASLHGISVKRVELLAKLSNSGKTLSPTENRGKHHNRPRAIPSALTELVAYHIEGFPKEQSHYSRSDNSCKHYLSADLNVTKMYELFLEKYKDNQEAQRIKYDFYYRFFKANFNYGFGSPRTDTCQTCDSMQNELKNPDLVESRKNELITLKNVHLAKAQAFYDELKSFSKTAEETVDVDVLSFDYQQNLPLPHVPAGDVFYKRQLWVFNFCIHSAKTRKAYFFMYDEATGKKTPNEPISFLDYYFKNLMDKDVKTLYLFSDNCAAQNKNSTLLFFLNKTAEERKIKILHHYPEPGHSFLPCDRAFGQIEKKKRLKERVYTPEEYCKIVKQSSKSFEVIAVQQSAIFDYKSYYEQSFKKLTVNDRKVKFQISKLRKILYDGNGQVQCSTNHWMEPATVQSYKIKEKNMSSSSRSDIRLKQAYSSQLPIPSAKYADVMSLVKKYVPHSHHDYYDALLASQDTSAEPRPESEED